MKAIVFYLTLILLSPFAVSAQVLPKLEWEKFLGSKRDELANMVISTVDGGLVLAGYTKSVGAGGEDAWIVKYDKDGNKLWEQYFGGKENDAAFAITQTTDKGFIFAGYTSSIGEGRKDLWFVKLNETGQKQWERTYGGVEDDWATSVNATSDGGALITGVKFRAKSNDAWVIKVNAAGNNEWERFYGEQQTNDGALSACVANDGGYLVAGFKTTNDKRSPWIVKLDANGNAQWVQQPGISAENAGAQCVATNDAGDFFVGIKVADKVFYILLDEKGQKKWEKGNESSSTGYVSSAISTPDNAFVLTFENPKGQPMVVKLKNDQAILWNLNLGKPGDQIRSLCISPDGRLIVAGSIESQGNGGKDMWINKMKDDELLLAFKAKSKEPKKEIKKAVVVNATVANNGATSNNTVIAKSDSTLKNNNGIAVSDSTKQKVYDNDYDEVLDYVKTQIQPWLQKGKYESTLDYANRVSVDKRKEKEMLFSQEAIHKFAKRKIDASKCVVDKDSYDADHQTYKVKLAGSPDMYLTVPKESAEQFEKRLDSTLRIDNVRYGLFEKKYVIAKADFIENNKSFHFEAIKTTAYGQKMKTYVFTQELEDMIPTPYSEAVKYVKGKMDTYMLKGEFEQPADYAARTTPQKKQEQATIFTNEVLTRLAKDLIKVSDNELSPYNPETQTFDISIANTDVIKLKVPTIKQAKILKENWTFVQIENLKYGFNDDKIIIYKATFAVNDSCTYTYNGLTDAPYAKSIMTWIDLDNIEYGRLDNSAYALFFDGKKSDNPAELQLSDLKLLDEDSNQVLDASEAASFSMVIKNVGKGKAYKVKCAITDIEKVPGLDFDRLKLLGDLAPNDKIDVAFKFKAPASLGTGKGKFAFKISEARGQSTIDRELEFETRSFMEPKLKVAESYFANQKGGKLKLDEKIYLKLRIENEGKGSAKGVNVKFTLPDNVIATEKNAVSIPAILPGSFAIVNFEFLLNKSYTSPDLHIDMEVNESVGKYGVPFYSAKTKMTDEALPYTKYNLVSDVDLNVPKQNDSIAKKNRFALIFGNENYNEESQVEYAAGDALMFKRYALASLGIPSENIKFVINGDKYEMEREINNLTEIVKATQGENEIFVFYAGHGQPDEQTKEAYIMPVNVKGTNVREGIKLSEFYKKLIETPNVSKAVVFIDACFSGGGRAEGLLAARAVKVKPKDIEMQQGKLLVFSASSGDQVALSFKEKNHGMFTYFLLKKMQETNGLCTYKDLAEYIRNNVEATSQRVNQKAQNPQVNVSTDAQSIWNDWRLR